MQTDHCKEIIRDMLTISFSYMESYIKRLSDLTKMDQNDPLVKQEIAQTNFFLTVLNDSIHPAHKLSYELFSGYSKTLDFYVKTHKAAVDTGALYTECFCVSVRS